MWDVHANGGVLIMVGLGERAILRCIRGRNCWFCLMDHLVLGVFGTCRFLVGMASCTCVLNTMWNEHGRRGVLLMVGLGERGILRCKWGCRKDGKFFFDEQIAQ